MHKMERRQYVMRKRCLWSSAYTQARYQQAYISVLAIVPQLELAAIGLFKVFHDASCMRDAQWTPPKRIEKRTAREDQQHERQRVKAFRCKW